MRLCYDNPCQRLQIGKTSGNSIRVFVRVIALLWRVTLWFRSHCNNAATLPSFSPSFSQFEGSSLPTEEQRDGISRQREIQTAVIFCQADMHV